MVDTHHGPAGTLVLLHVVAALRTEPDPVPILYHNMVDYNVQELHLVNSPATHIIVQVIRNSFCCHLILRCYDGLSDV